MKMPDKIKSYFGVYFGAILILTIILVLSIYFAINVLGHYLSIRGNYLVAIMRLTASAYDVIIVFTALMLSFFKCLSKKDADIVFLTSVEIHIMNLNFFKAILILLLYTLVYAACSFHFYSFGFIFAISFISSQFYVETLFAAIFAIFLFFAIQVTYLPNIHLISALFFIVERTSPLAVKKMIPDLGGRHECK